MLATEVVAPFLPVVDVAEMEILILSQEDSRLPIIDLARTLGDMTKQEKLFAEEISTDLIHEHLTGSARHPTHYFLMCPWLMCPESLMTEPDLLILFSPRVDLQGFPPWQILLTEILYPLFFVRC
jgi:undecaprenyl pyrophosphate synthase